ncbi:hypothetical protein ACIBSW_13235 [Actinoplanes sp. NPDC049668]|uniref:hypothetical protein n=1 Tax=unclassified Actinoplanes TaxID=2626549 RepID=UPI0033A1A5FA
MNNDDRYENAPQQQTYGQHPYQPPAAGQQHQQPGDLPPGMWQPPAGPGRMPQPPAGPGQMPYFPQVSGMQITPELAQHQANMLHQAGKLNKGVIVVLVAVMAAMTLAFAWVGITTELRFALVLALIVPVVFGGYLVATRRMRRSQQGMLDEMAKMQQRQADALRRTPR